MAELTLQELVGDFRVTERSISVGAAVVSIAANDPTRWALLIARVGSANSITFSTRGNVTINDGILASQSPPGFVINFRDVGALVQAAWFAIASVANQLLTVIEVFYRPQGRVPTQDEMIALSAKMGGKR